MQATLDKKVMDILVSPCRVDILNQLAKSEGKPLEEISNQMITQSAGIKDHIAKLLEDSIIKSEDGKYQLTKEGKELYKLLQKIVIKANVV